MNSDSETVAGPTGPPNDIVIPTYMYRSEDVDDDDVHMPGERTVEPLCTFDENVIISCPVCAGPVDAVLVRRSGSNLKGITEMTLRILSSSCECPRVYLQYDN